MVLVQQVTVLGGWVTVMCGVEQVSRLKVGESENKFYSLGYGRVGKDKEKVPDNWVKRKGSGLEKLKW